MFSLHTQVVFCKVFSFGLTTTGTGFCLSTTGWGLGFTGATVLPLLRTAVGFATYYFTPSCFCGSFGDNGGDFKTNFVVTSSKFFALKNVPIL